MRQTDRQTLSVVSAQAEGHWYQVERAQGSGIRVMNHGGTAPSGWPSKVAQPVSSSTTTVVVASVVVSTARLVWRRPVRCLLGCVCCGGHRVRVREGHEASCGQAEE